MWLKKSSSEQSIRWRLISSAKIQDKYSIATLARTLKIVDEAVNWDIENMSLLLQQETTDMMPQDYGINFVQRFALSGTPCCSFPKQSHKDNTCLKSILLQRNLRTVRLSGKD